MFAHLSALLGGIVTAGWAGCLGCFIGPLVIWLVKKETMPFVDDQGKEALNFQLTLLIAYVIGVVSSFFFVGFLVILAAAVLAVVFSIMAAVAASNGQYYRYPLTIEFVR